MTRRTRGIFAVPAATLLMVALAGPVSADLGATAWAGSGTATATCIGSGIGGSAVNDTTVVADGTTGPATFSYAFFDPDNGCGDGSWTFSTVADQPGSVTLDWAYSGTNAYFQVRAGLSAFLTPASGTPTTNTLVADGPVNCCTAPSVNFSYSGSLTFDVQPGDQYGFTMTGSNGDSNSTLSGTLTVTTTATPDAPSPTATPSPEPTIPPTSTLGSLPGGTDGSGLLVLGLLLLVAGLVLAIRPAGRIRR